MIVTLHGLTTMHSNIKTDIWLAKEIGYQGVEIVESKLVRFLDVGLKVEELSRLFNDNNLKPVCINALKNIEVIESDKRGDLMHLAERLCRAAEILGCPTIQLVPFCSLEGRPVEEIIELTARNVRDIADIGKKNRRRRYPGGVAHHSRSRRPQRYG